MRPAGWWYGIAAGVGVLGIVVAAVVGLRSVDGLIDRVDGFSRVPVPGAGTVEVTDAGEYTIYHEYPGANSDESGIIDVSFDATLIAPDGSDVPLEPYGAEVRYGFGDHEGVAVYSFEATEPGNYELTTTGGPGTAAVGGGIGQGIVTGLLAGLGIGIGGVVAAILIAVLVAVRRGQDRRRREVLGHRGPWTGPPGTGWPEIPTG